MNRNYSLLCLLSILACFLSQSAAREAIIGGSFAKLPNFQYQAAIYANSDDPNCGGGIIKDLFILTAANCVIIKTNGEYASKKNMSVLVGTVNLNIDGTLIGIEKIFLPIDTIPFGDIAVLKLQEPLDFGRHHWNLQLSEHEPESYSAEIQISGFGWDTFTEPNKGENFDQRLRFADVKVRTQVECQHDHPRRNFQDKYFCARIMQLNRNAHRGTCDGDEGGPLVHKERTIIGVLSKPTSDCKERKSSAIYTNVAYYRHFILDAIHNNVTNLRIIKV